MKRILLLFLLMATMKIFAQEVSANATRPSAADNGFLTSYGYTELELGWAAQENFWSIPAMLKFTALPNFELGFLMSGIVNHSEFAGTSETEVGDFGVQLKSQIYSDPGMSIALLGRSEFLQNENNRFTLYSAWSFTREMFQLDATVGGVFHSRSFAGDQSFIYAVALSPNFDSPMGIYLEIFGESNEVAKPVYADVGISYAVSPRFILDAAYFAGLNDHAVDWQFQVGFTTTLFQLLGK
ncbi:MAG: transporter [Melioribacteraceae bacterium]|nr:transporter [Melioribacteraceae bacterium]